MTGEREPRPETVKVHWGRCLARPAEFAPTKGCKCRHCENQRKWYGKYRPDILNDWKREGRA